MKPSFVDKMIMLRKERSSKARINASLQIWYSKRMDYCKTSYRSVKSYFAPLWKECEGTLEKEGKVFNYINANAYFSDKKDPDDPFEASNDLYFEGMEISSLQDRRETMKKVLAINPFEYDAERELINLTGVYQEQDRLPLYLALKEKMEKDLFSYASPSDHQLYGDITARPYFRLLGDIANAYHQIKDFENEGKIEETILKMNQEDNQGVRYLLAPLYLSKNETDKFKELFLQYSGETLMDAYAYVNACLEKDIDSAKKLLQQVYSGNPFIFLLFQVSADEVQIFATLKGEKEETGYYRPGAMSEAKVFFEELYGYDAKDRFVKAINKMIAKIFDPFAWLKGMNEIELIELNAFLFTQSTYCYQTPEDYYQGYLKNANRYKKNCASKKNYLSLAQEAKKTIEDFVARSYIETVDGMLRLSKKGEHAAVLAGAKTNPKR